MYRVQPTAGDVGEEDVHIYMYVVPGLNACANSVVCATVPPPLSHILTDYKNLHNARIRRSNADAWNRAHHQPVQAQFPYIGRSDPGAHGFPRRQRVCESHLWQGRPPVAARPQLVRARHADKASAGADQHASPASVHAPAGPRRHPADHARPVRGSVVPAQQVLARAHGRRGGALRDVDWPRGVNADAVKKTMTSGRLFSPSMRVLPPPRVPFDGGLLHHLQGAAGDCRVHPLAHAPIGG